MQKYHNVEKVEIKNGILKIVVDGKKIERELKALSPKFINASRESISNFEISPSGYGIHWPILDEDISIDGLLGITHKPEVLKQKIA